MRGPEYHAQKKKLSLEQLGITLLEIWQDDIENGNFKSMLTDFLEAEIISSNKRLKQFKLDKIEERTDGGRIND